MKILIVDDEAAVRELLGEMADELGHEVCLAQNGRDAWRLFDEQPVQVLITDWLMPGVDGLELTRQIRASKRTRYTYVIMLTALGGTERYLEGHRGAHQSSRRASGRNRSRSHDAWRGWPGSDPPAQE